MDKHVVYIKYINGIEYKRENNEWKRIEYKQYNNWNVLNWFD